MKRLALCQWQYDLPKAGEFHPEIPGAANHSKLDIFEAPNVRSTLNLGVFSRIWLKDEQMS